MQESLETGLKEVVKILNSYAKLKEYKEIESLEKYFETFFDAQTVKLWKVDSYKETLQLFGRKESEMIPLEQSLIKRAMDTKSILLVNHVTSEKYFNAKVDNPLNLKIKSLMVLPIMQGKNVIGLLKVWKGRGQKKVFNKKDEEALVYFSSLLVKLLKAEEIDKNELLSLLGKKSNEKTDKVISRKTSTDIQKIPRKKKIDELEVLKNEMVKISKENKYFLDELKRKEETLLAYKDKVSTLEESTSNSSELEISKRKYQELEKSSTELYHELQSQQVALKELDEELQLSQKENEYLKVELKEKEKSCLTIQDLKSEKLHNEEKESSQIDKNIENVLHYIDNKFGENEYTYMLFEMMLYALNSKNALPYIEENLKKLNIIQKIIEGYHFKNGLRTHDEKNRMSDLVEHIQRYENIFPNKIQLVISLDTSMPKSLVFDKIKIQNCIMHLLMDLYRFVDYSRNIHIDFTFENKLLTVEIGGSIHKKNSLFKSMFRQTKLGGDEKNRIGLQLSKKIMTRLKGEVGYLYKDNYYKFILTLPTQVIKI